MGLTSDGRYVSVRRNAEATSLKFKYDVVEGYFGDKHPRSKTKVREIVSDSPVKDARKLFEQITDGGEKEIIAGLKGKAMRLPDGALITLRIITSSSGSPAVDINVKSTVKDTKVKSQKIHFKKGKKL